MTVADFVHHFGLGLLQGVEYTPVCVGAALGVFVVWGAGERGCVDRWCVWGGRRKEKGQRCGREGRELSARAVLYG